MNNEFISIMTERIVRDFDPLQIILFGSHARGDADRHSDIDLLIVFERLADKDKRKTEKRFSNFSLTVLQCPHTTTFCIGPSVIPSKFLNLD